MHVLQLHISFIKFLKQNLNIIFLVNRNTMNTVMALHTFIFKLIAYNFDWSRLKWWDFIVRYKAASLGRVYRGFWDPWLPV